MQKVQYLGIYYKFNPIENLWKADILGARVFAFKLNSPKLVFHNTLLMFPSSKENFCLMEQKIGKKNVCAIHCA
jgi:hypothetical protein